MKKGKKPIIIKTDKVRVATYLPKEVSDLLTNEANKTGVSESTFIRQMIYERLKPEIINA